MIALLPCEEVTALLPCYARHVIDDLQARRLALTYVWWQSPEVTLANPRKLLCQILRMGRAEDYVRAERLWGVDALREALLGALPGDIDAKSQHFWRLRFDLEDGE